MLRFIRNNLIVLQIILIMPVIFVGFYLQFFITFDLRTSGFAKYVLIDYPEIGNILRCVAFLILPIVYVAIYYTFPRFNVTYIKILLIIISIPFLVLYMCLIWIRKLYLSILIK